MFNSQQTNLSKEAIASRMFRNAARFWGLNDTNLDNFDPLVRLLIEACAVEIYRVDNEMVNLQKSITERLAGLLIPEVYLQPKPAHAIIHASSEDDYTYLSKETQFLNKKKVASVENGPLDSSLDVFFSPVGKSKVINSDVKYLATVNSIYKVNEKHQKESFLRLRSGKQFRPQTIWIGIDVATNTDMEDVSIFFDLNNTPGKARLLSMLSYLKCDCNGHNIKLTKGLPNNSSDEHEHSFEDSLEELYVNRKLEKMINRIYSNNFMTITGDNQVLKHIETSALKRYPDEFTTLLDESDLEQFDTHILWLRLSFPPEFIPQVLDDMIVAINCFPVANRHLNKITYRLNTYFNIVPLLSEEQYFAIQHVEGTYIRPNGRTDYVYYPFDSFDENEKGNYTVRFGDLQRFDNRNAAEYLNYLVELLRDESRSFAAFGQDFLDATIKELNQNIGLIEKKINQNLILLQTAPTYLLISPLEDGDTIFIQYWTCNGAAGNGIRSGSPIDLYEGSGYRKKGLVLMTQTHGGMDKLKNTEILTAFKSVLLSRNRIVTEADIRSFCMSYLHTKARAIDIERSAVVSAMPNQGLMPAVIVKIKPNNSNLDDGTDWESIKIELHEELSNLSAVDTNYVIEVVT